MQAFFSFLKSLFGPSQVANLGLLKSEGARSYEMQLSNEEVEQLRTAGFSDAQITDVNKLKNHATAAGTPKVDWQNIITQLITNGPAILSFLKMIIGIFVPPTPGPVVQQ